MKIANNEQLSLRLPPTTPTYPVNVRLTYKPYVISYQDRDETFIYSIYSRKEYP